MNTFISEWRTKRKSRKKDHKRIAHTIRKKINLEQSDELHREAFDQINCLDCANCCKSIPPLVTKTDVSRISKKLGLKEAQFMEEYITEDSEGNTMFKYSPCRFLLEDNTCLIYEDRPKACRRYPHTDQGELQKYAQILPQNAQYCPAVFYILEKINERYYA